MVGGPNHYKAGLTLGQELIYTQKTDLCMKIADCEQSCCLSKHTHRALRGRICWQRRCYSLCRTLIPLPRSILPSRVSLDDSGAPAASGSLQKPRGFLRLCKGLVWGNSESPRGDQACPGAALPAGDVGTGGSLPRQGQQDSFASQGKSLSVRASALPAPSE